MSEYQYYEFQAVDRPLTEPEMRELRACSFFWSTRPRISILGEEVLSWLAPRYTLDR